MHVTEFFIWTHLTVVYSFLFFFVNLILEEAIGIFSIALRSDYLSAMCGIL